MCALTLPTLPTNTECQKIEERFNNGIIISCTSSESAILIPSYIQQIQSIESSVKEKKQSSKLERLKKLGLIGSLNDTGVTSMNYKETLYSDEDNKDEN